MIIITVVIIFLVYKISKAEKAYRGIVQRLGHLVEIGRLSEDDYAFASGSSSPTSASQSMAPQSTSVQSASPQSSTSQNAPPQSVPPQSAPPQRVSSQAEAFCIMPVGQDKPEFISVQEQAKPDIASVRSVVCSAAPEDYYGSTAQGAAARDKQMQKKSTTPVKEDRDVSTINVVLVIGTLFVILSGLIFATTTWQVLNNGVRSVIILALTAIFYAVSVIAEKKLKLDRTGVAFFTLGSVFMPTTLVAAGFFKLFGEWFSFFGEGRYLLLCVIFAVLFGTLSASTVKYKKNPLALMALCSMSASVTCMFRWISGYDGDVFALIIAVYSALIAVSGIFVKRIKSEKLGIFLSMWDLFSCINLPLLSIIGIISSGKGILACFCAAVSALLFLDRRLSTREQGYGIIPFAVLSAVSAYKFITPTDATGFLFIFAVASAAVFAVGLAGGYTERAKTICSVSGICAMSVSLLLSIDSVINVTFTYSLLAAVAVMLGISVYYIVAEKIKPAGIVFALLSMYLFYGTGLLSGIDKVYVPAFMSTITVILFALLYFIKKLPIRSAYTDGVFCMGLTVTALIKLFSASSFDSISAQPHAAVAVYIMLAATVILALTAFEKNASPVSKICCWVLPFNLAHLVIPLKDLFPLNSDMAYIAPFICVMILYAAACAVYLFREKNELCARVHIPLLISTLLTCLSMTISNLLFSAPSWLSEAYSLAFFALLIFFALLTKNSATRIMWSIFATISSLLSLLAFSIGFGKNYEVGKELSLVWFGIICVMWLVFYLACRKSKRFLPLAVSFSVLIIAAGICGCADNKYEYAYSTAVWAVLSIISLKKENGFMRSLARYTTPVAGLGAVMYIMHAVGSFKGETSYVLWYAVFAISCLAADLLSKKYPRFEGFSRIMFIYTAISSLIAAFASSYDAFTGGNENRMFVAALWIAAVFMGIRVLRGERKRSSLYLMITIAVFAVFDTAGFAFNGCNVIYAFYATFAFASAVAFFIAATENLSMKTELRDYFSVALWVITMLTMFIGSVELPGNPFGALAVVLVVAASYAYSYSTADRNNILAAPAIIFLAPYISYACDSYYDNIGIANLAMFIIFATSGRLLHSRICDKTESGSTVIDWPSISAFIPALILSVGGSSAAWCFTGSLMLALYPILFYKRIGYGEKSCRVILSLTAALSCIAWWRQPFTLPEIIRLEFNFIPLCLLCFVLWHIWQEHRNVFETAGFVTAVITILHMSSDALNYGHLADSLILIVGVIGMLLVSFAIKKRKWFILAVVTLLAVTLCMTKDFWQSLAWWAYLLIVGILLIVIAAANELGKQKSSADDNSTKVKIRRFMEEWTW